MLSFIFLVTSDLDLDGQPPLSYIEGTCLSGDKCFIVPSCKCSL